MENQEKEEDRRFEEKENQEKDEKQEEKVNG